MIRQLHDVIITVPVAGEHVSILLDEWDTYIAAYAAAMREATQARHELAMAREPMVIIEAETLRTVEGRTRSERRARTLLVLHRHDGWCGYQRAVRAARGCIHEAEQRAAVAQMRIELVRAALTAVLGGRHDVR